MLHAVDWSVVYVPLWDDPDHDADDEPDRFIRSGVRVELSDDSVVFYSYRHGSYTVTMPPCPALNAWDGRHATDSVGRPIYRAGQKLTSAGLMEFLKGHSARFVAEVLRGISLAEEEAAARRHAA